MATAERRAREKEQRRREILDAARRVFFSKGIHRATMDDVAAAAELGKGTLYIYFSSKEELLAHLLLEGLNLLNERLEKAYSPGEEVPPDERIKRLSCAYVNFFQEYPGYLRLMVAFDRSRLTSTLPENLCREILEQNRKALSWVTQAIDEGMQKEIFRNGDAWLTAGALWASVHGVLILMSTPFRREMLGSTLEEMLNVTLKSFLEGLRANSDAR